MPQCSGCGASYEDTFKFCPFCGRAKPEPNVLHVSVTSDDVWEQCETKLVHGKSEKGVHGFFKATSLLYFEATAIGPKGKYAAARSDWLPSSKVIYDTHSGGVEIRSSARPHLDTLITQLSADGWQYIGQGEEWYNQRFRRRVRT